MHDDRSEYGHATLKQLAQRLQQEYGAGFSYSSLTRMTKFYAYISDYEKVATLSQQLSWSHFVELIKIEDELKRGFYTRLCSEARWSVRTLRELCALRPVCIPTLERRNERTKPKIFRIKP